MSPSRYDVAIVGAGPAGAATAIALLQRGFSVALLERTRCGDAAENIAEGANPRRPRAWSPGEGLSAIAQSALQELGQWQAFQQQGHRPSYLTQSAWGSDELRDRYAISHKLGPDYHLDRPRFDEWLRRRAAAAGADLFDATQVERATWLAAGCFELCCSRALPSSGAAREEFALEAAHIVDATGRSAALLRKFGGVRQQVDDLVCVGRCYDETVFEPSILVETAANGWWYSSPLPDRSALALYFTRAALARRTRSEQDFQATLAQTTHLARRFASATRAGPIRFCAAAPVKSTWPSELPLLPVGDAAAAFDPIAGSGLCFAFRSALEAASVLDDARAGRGIWFAGYQQGVGNVFDQHVRRRRELYAHEKRWPGSEFWARVARVANVQREA
ncbi:MAG TPA: FAD-dependent oxidoreductase [Polyangiaceae bacterium]|nr:FAD-dependent oxidoreductase [Polyangiaceae bacterium]